MTSERVAWSRVDPEVELAVVVVVPEPAREARDSGSVTPSAGATSMNVPSPLL